MKKAVDPKARQAGGPAAGARKKRPPNRRFPIVGIGASAGGLGAFEKFFSSMPGLTESGMALVLIQHLDPGHKSILTELVGRYTPKTVSEVSDGMAVAPDQVYIIPPNKDMVLAEGRFQLLRPSAPRGLRLTVDVFFRSLAADQGERAIGIVLSGSGSDGTLGLRAIKEAGGMAMVQDPATAEFDGMPRSAAATGLADFVLPPEKMAERLIAYARRTWDAGLPNDRTAADFGPWLPRIFALLRAQTGHDFTFYKHSTINRRIERRMAVNQIDRIEDYFRYLGQAAEEREALYNDLLIGVTGFFRDKEAFAALEAQVLPGLFERMAEGHPLRAWAAGCSTGEEAYSLAILFQEYAERMGLESKAQVFATDIDHRAIEQARAGVYPDSISIDVAPERLARFFLRQEPDSYRVKKSTRDLLVFSEQDVIKDPPFSRLDLIVCRNLLIYLGPELQRKVFHLFHYALRPGGVLFLGGSESIGEFGHLFETLDRKWKIYRRGETAVHRPYRGAPVPDFSPPPGDAPPASAADRKKPDIRSVTEQIILQEYAPACVTVNARGEILYIQGRTGQYLELIPGEIDVNVARIAREGLRLELSTGLRKAASSGETVRFEGLRVRTDGGVRFVDLTVRPLGGASAAPELILIIFEEVREPPAASTPPPAGGEARPDPRIALLESELRTKEEYLQSAVEELETANEELKSTNEELQSTNEELETSKEELQSVNEELVTVNTELREKIDDLSRINDDMNNLLAGTGIATIFVDLQLAIKRFTPSAAEIVNLIPADVGRPVGHIASNLSGYDRLVEDLRKTVEDLAPREAEVRTLKGRWFMMRIQPYRTQENVIEGAVVTFTDITDRKRAEARTVVEADLLSGLDDAVIGLDETLKVVFWSRGAAALLGWTAAQTVGRDAGPFLQGHLEGSAADDAFRRLQDLERFEGPIRFRVRDGSLIEADVHSAALNGPDGNFSGLLVVIRKREMPEPDRGP